ncbi:MAG: glycosyltransferase family 2 protein [Nitriliruptoraceae bacterium]
MTRAGARLSVIMPVRNEADHLEDAVAAVLAQRYPGELQLVLAVAPSTDATESIAHRLAEAEPLITVVDNPAGTTPAALNRAIAAATGEVIARVDAHAELTPGYLERAVALLDETGAANVGGIQRALGTTPMQRAVAAAMSSRFGTGDARFHYGGEPGPIDSVYLGVFRAEVLRELGGFDEQLLRNQDYELNVRIRQHGGVVWFDPCLEVRYRPRASLGALAAQYWQYGRWKRATIRKHPDSLRWRQLAPPAAVVANAAALLAMPLNPWVLVVPATYLVGVLGASAVTGARDPRVAVRLPLVFATMHHSWGAGFLLGPPRDPEG